MEYCPADPLQITVKGIFGYSFSREIAQDTDKSKHTGSAGKKGNETVTNEKHVMMQSIAFVIYEMNKCAVTTTRQNTGEFMSQLVQTKAIYR